MDDPKKNATHPRVDLRYRPLPPPLTEVFSIAIKNHNAVIAVAIGDVHVAIAGIRRNACWTVGTQGPTLGRR